VLWSPNDGREASSGMRRRQTRTTSDTQPRWRSQSWPTTHSAPASPAQSRKERVSWLERSDDPLRGRRRSLRLQQSRRVRHEKASVGPFDSLRSLRTGRRAVRSSPGASVTKERVSARRAVRSAQINHRTADASDQRESGHRAGSTSRGDLPVRRCGSVDRSAARGIACPASRRCRCDGRPQAAP